MKCPIHGVELVKYETKKGMWKCPVEGCFFYATFKSWDNFRVDMK